MLSSLNANYRYFLTVHTIEGKLPIMDYIVIFSNHNEMKNLSQIPTEQYLKEPLSLQWQPLYHPME